MYYTKIAVEFGLLHAMAEQGGMMLVFLPNGAVWAGDPCEMDDLAGFVREWEEANAIPAKPKGTPVKHLKFLDEDADVFLEDKDEKKPN